ncbi:hypothetical protein IWW38_005324 [Coemansia aciculifera]|uniref:Uncharacterized protein n=1 Tax=Coemansia aciculifera TaxID=417176 RepID=A0ACC1LVC9_9FUNG|nr:hypothetical protein IWW38_005324 [Coemansia aciculifera]
MTVEVVVPVKEWSVTCRYLSEAKEAIRPDLQPHAQRPGGKGMTHADWAASRKRWQAWAEGRANRAAERVGKMLLACYSEPWLPPRAEPRRMAQSTASEEGEIMDEDLTPPGAAVSVAGVSRTRTEAAASSMEVDQDEARKRKAGKSSVASTNSFAALDGRANEMEEIEELGSASNPSVSQPENEQSAMTGVENHQSPLAAASAKTRGGRKSIVREGGLGSQANDCV